ncbi:MAG TPA: glycosyltransferase family 2 protein [Steroidobacter sp.]|uniref:glycosyltransferase family 2 protein n=1 Tax=Steroidobacter sp. TaxID=1978227 RepID=UPI002EF76529
MSAARPAGRFAVCVVIPVYNHEHAIGTVVTALRAQALPVILVDDGCGPACARELQRLSALPEVTLLRHETNRGKGAAVITGFREAEKLGFTHAIQVDADGQHTLNDARRFVEAAREEPDALICGRPIFDSSIPKARYYGRYLSHGMVWLQTLSLDIIDSMCGFRLYPLTSTLYVMNHQHIGARMDFDTEILVRMHWRQVPIRWLDTRVSYPIDGVSHYRLFLDNVRMTALHVRLTVGMLIRLPVLLWRKIARPKLARQMDERDFKA